MKFAIAALIATSYAIKLTDHDSAIQEFKQIAEVVEEVHEAMEELLVRYEDGEFDCEVKEHLEDEEEAAEGDYTKCDYTKCDSDEDAQDDEGDQGDEGVDGEVTDHDSATPEEADVLKDFVEREGLSEEQKGKLMQVFLEFKSLNFTKKQEGCVVKKLLQEAGLIEPENEDTPVPDCEHLEEDDHEDADQTGDQDDDEEEPAYQVQGWFGDVFGFVFDILKIISNDPFLPQ